MVRAAAARRMPADPVPSLQLLNHSVDDVDDDADDDAINLTSTAAASNGDVAQQPDSNADKVRLNFKTQSGKSIVVRVGKSDALSKAFDTFTAHAHKEGWLSDKPSKFVSPDGDKLTGTETPDDLGLENDDMIEVHGS